MNEKQKHFQEILESFSTAMFTTLGGDGIPRARPMQIAEVSSDQQVWFFTRLSSEKIDEIQADPTVCVTMQGGGKFLSLSGTASVVRDQDHIDRLWSEPYKVWFPEGKNSPNVTLLSVEPTSGEYWDTSGLTGLRYFYEAGKAYFQGSEIDTEGLDVNAKVKL
jgi:general stress protein 26